MLGRAQLSWDVMSATNSTLLSLALADYLPPECQTPSWRLHSRSIGDHIVGYKAPADLFPGHHLVYCPLQKTASQLCADGTDPMHSPGAPYTRRMWAGGSLEFRDDRFCLDAHPVVCRERVVDVAEKGAEDDPDRKIFVVVLREYMRASDYGMDPERSMTRGIAEHRTLVFMRGQDKEEARARLAKEQETVKTLKAHHPPDATITLTPTPTLLFQYSALTFNAHSIHLDPEYCREVEGRRNLLVHGPLSLTLMLSLLQSRLEQNEKICNIDYRNLAPLYVNEPLHVCVRRIDRGDETGNTGQEDGPAVVGGPRRWEVWVEGPERGLSVRGTAVTTITDAQHQKNKRLTNLQKKKGSKNHQQNTGPRNRWRNRGPLKHVS
ncbi:hypothetical protein GGR52DRAFT_529504 [Hypoxylon sp. FL1284]|nr:hypothetical protein GGR52DRAFT_529504 [Hypoxylon sp. FL1284]